MRREYIGSRWGEKYLPEEPRHFKSRANAQDGHEAIRPTMVGLAPDQVKDSLTNDQYKLYKLIWERFLACQMAQCLQSTTQADITGNGYVFKASGYTVTFDGFTVLYVEGRDEAQEDEGALPPLEKDMTVRAKEIAPEPALHPAAAPLYRSLPDQGDGGIRHRPPVHLCGHDHHHHRQRVCGPGWQGVKAYGAGRGVLPS